MSEPIKAGDIVELKSGSHHMTVDSIENDRATCTWITNGQRQTDRFPVASLKLVPEEDGPKFVADYTGE
jgi:uncharacterized protein YodC (DUF2158 family)